jgi:hypothetical protein
MDTDIFNHEIRELDERQPFRFQHFRFLFSTTKHTKWDLPQKGAMQHDGICLQQAGKKIGRDRHPARRDDDRTQPLF